ncbi:MAG: hypothetical protein ACTSQ9_00795 [Candidatus Hodarchaeales archaeon]
MSDNAVELSFGQDEPCIRYREKNNSADGIVPDLLIIFLFITPSYQVLERRSFFKVSR